MSAEKFAGKYRIPSARAAWWDYAADATYFVTICTDEKRHFFGRVENMEMQHSEIGRTAFQYWQDIPQHFPFVSLDVFVIMPNHVHGIIVIDKNKHVDCIENVQPQTTINKFGPQSQNLGSIIRGFKSAVKTFATTNAIPFAWQARFHDHIIRDEAEYRRIVDYICNNPARWADDKFYTE